MEHIQVKALGQIPEADITFGDMTVFVGEQASGKSILLQLVKLILDTMLIRESLEKQGFNWQEKRENFLHLYFGEGMQNIWNSEETQITVDKRKFNLDRILRGFKTSGQGESLLLIPALRTGVFKNGWPRGFTDYETGDPYVVKQFSEQLRLLMVETVRPDSSTETIFPQIKGIPRILQVAIQESIFADAKVKLDSSGLRRRIVLDFEGNELPFMVWSAGQREFMPLLMGLYLLMPPGERKNEHIEWVAIEEPEVGLHPKAISVLLAVFLELMSRGYKVIVSTHSSQVLELVWGIQHLAELKAEPTALLKMLDLEPQRFPVQFAQTALEKKFKTYYFSRQGGSVEVKDISTLDAEDTDEAVSDFGGLTAFSTKTSEVVSEAIWKGKS